MVRFLLDKGADVNQRTSAGWTPINQAVYSKNAIIVKMLKDRGADTSVKNPYGETPLVAAGKKGLPDIVAILKNNPAINSPVNDANRSTATLESPKKSTFIPDSNNISIEPKKKVSFSPIFRIIKPIPKWIWATAITPIRSPSNFKSEYGKITNWGFGSGLEMHLNDGFTLFFDLTTYKYKLEIAEKGETVHPALGNAESADVSSLTLADGAKYSNNTGSLRLGIKYNFYREKVCQPWIGFAYGMNVWQVKYLTWDEKKTYGKANGTQWRPAILAGIDFKTKDMGTYTFFFEAIGTTAQYTMKDLFGLGDYDTHGASAEMGYPTPRIGFSVSF